MEEEFTSLWRALADPTRRMLLDVLRERPRTTGELCSLFQVSRFAVMKHLTVLEEAGLIIVKREGRERWNYLNAVPLQQMYERWLRPYEAQWAGSLLRLKRSTEALAERENKMSGQTVVNSAIKTMHIELEIVIKATPERVFAALTEDVSGWWDSEHCTYKRGKMILEPEVGKRFYEDWGDGGEGALFGIVTLFEKNKVLEIEGAMGMEKPVHGLIRYELVPQEGTTLLKFTHRAFGDLKEDAERKYTGGWQDMLGVRLPAYLESRV
ncbi:MAG TPA: metalloregulator ArsR/SmtB family transcription factor [Ktedonobacteraceae bacterium]